MRKLATAVFLGLFFSLSIANNDTLTVAFNKKTHKYHYLTCVWAERCTRNCVDIPLKEAIALGGVPCKVCHPPIK